MELCDLLAVFENDVFIFSDKSIAWSQNKSTEVAWKRWYGKAIEESAKQLRGAERHLKFPQAQVFTDASCSTVIPVGLPSAEVARFHHIAVAHGAAEACRKHFGGGSGSLQVRTPVVGLADPFVVGSVTEHDRFIHVLDEAALEIVLSNLDTIPEFRDYLLAKEGLLAEGKHFVAAGEEDLLAIYLQSDAGPGSARHGFGDTTGFDLIAVPEGEWLAFERSPEKAARDRANEVSYAWDELIDRFAKHSIGGTQYPLFPANTPQRTERALRLLNAEPRTLRRALAQNCLSSLQQMGTREVILWGVRPSPQYPTYYTFVALRAMAGESYEDYRKRRAVILTGCTARRRLKSPDAPYHIGIAFDALEATGVSEDIVLIDDAAWGPELERFAQEFQETTGPFIVQTSRHLHVSEYPSVDGPRE